MRTSLNSKPNTPTIEKKESQIKINNEVKKVDNTDFDNLFSIKKVENQPKQEIITSQNTKTTSTIEKKDNQLINNNVKNFDTSDFNSLFSTSKETISNPHNMYSSTNQGTETSSYQNNFFSTPTPQTNLSKEEPIFMDFTTSTQDTNLFNPPNDKITNQPNNSSNFSFNSFM